MGQKLKPNDMALSRLSTKLDRLSPESINELTLGSMLLEYVGNCYPFEECSGISDSKIARLEKQINVFIENLPANEQKVLTPLIGTFKMAQFFANTEVKNC
ncbi:hypothetical protein [Pseudemcibacter aquimaris]|uniref:hypothetical protein n=1 Tax=Pseudemcibacter aquimaris TaxID=2857064 RepID=UPI0020120884|nr:hypothetical protein [Pseudemcibacter aquimaris]MCC3859588.1 hypothetical protein [Pseudemcibacter aquimaris]WDU59984.1 hypothetical protein KW060_06905 [Pseudemcibacter aquimaris]